MDEARAILDQLMGKTRDFTENQKVTMHQIHFYDDQVCKYYICGLCPYIAFGGTKSDMGKCSSAVCGTIHGLIAISFNLSKHQVILMRIRVATSGTNCRKKKRTNMGKSSIF